MSDLCPTLNSLIALGFERWHGQSRPRDHEEGAVDALLAIHGLREPAFGADAVLYRLASFDLFCSHTMNRRLRMVVRVHGVISTRRRLSEIDSEIPDHLAAPLEAAAWVSYALQSYKSDFQPLPEWFVEGERHWDLIPFVAENRAYEARPKCYIDSDYARLLRRNLREAISWLREETEMTFSFDGRVLSIEHENRTHEVLASGDGWQSSYRVIVTRESKLPARFTSGSVVVSVFDGYLSFNDVRLGTCEAIA